MHALWEHHPLDWLRHEDELSLPLSSSTRIRQSSVWPCAPPPLTNALQPGQRSDVPCVMKSLWLRYSLLRTGSRFGSGGRASTRCLSNRCAPGSTSLRVPLEQMNSAGVHCTSAAEKGSLSDTIFHLSSALALLIVQTMRNLQSKSTTM